MGYYTIRLDPDAQKLCTIVTPFGKYEYLRLPMGISCSPDIFQEKMSSLMQHLDFVKTYLDDILVISCSTFEDHISKLEIVLKLLAEKGLRINAKKSTFCTDQIEYLGYWITKSGIQPMPNKVEAIKNMARPTTRKELRRFIGMVNYYRDMWCRRSDLLAPLTSMTSKNVKFDWTDEHQHAFDNVKKIICREVLLNYPDFSKTFHIYTDASDTQLGSVITQDDKPIAFYSRKLNSAQKRYTTGEQELLSIVETLREFRNILLGYKIVVHTDHKNLTYEKCSSDRVMRWCLLIKEFGPEFKYIKGKHNLIADALSRLELNPEEKPTAQCMVAFITRTPNLEQTLTPDHFEMAENFGIDTKERNDYTFPMDIPYIAEKQKEDKRLMTEIKKENHKYKLENIERTGVLTRDGKIYIPIAVRKDVMAWYHEYLCHPGATRTEATIRSTMTWPGLTKDVLSHCKKCKLCQLHKKNRKQYGKLPVKTAEINPWQIVQVDLIGPWTVKTPSGKKQLRAFTAIDPATSWVELSAIPNKNADTVMDAFHNSWLTRYPRPIQVTFDNGSEFKNVFKEMCDNLGIKCKPTTSYNPQGNSIIERVHQVMANMLRAFELEERDLDPEDPWNEFLQACAYGIRSTYHTTLQATPGQLIFGRDMIHDVRFQANWDRIARNKTKIIKTSNKRENLNRIKYVYKVGDRVLLRKPGLRRKLSAPKEGPYTVLSVATNGTIKIQRGIVQERVNIRRVEPYFE